MANSNLCWALSAVFLMGGCEGTILRLHVESTLPEPNIRLERKLDVSKIHVYKLARSNDGLSKEVEYWGLAAGNRESEGFRDEIRYGYVPKGFLVSVAAKQLDYGSYYVVIGSHVQVATGGFFVLRNREGRPSLLGLNEPFIKFKDEFFKCVEDFSYLEDEVKSNCVPVPRP